MKVRALTLAIFACALLLRALVPAGWMPVADAHGLRIMPCSGTGPMLPTMAADSHHGQGMAMARGDMPGMAHHGQHDGKGPSDHPCAFSGLSLALDLPDLPAPAPIAPAEVRDHGALALGSAIGRGLAAPPPPATGPPLTT